MYIARVVGNVVSTINPLSHRGKKLMIIEYVDGNGHAFGERSMAVDAASSGIGDIVLVNTDGGAGQMMLETPGMAVDLTICGVIDYVSYKSGENNGIHES